VALAAWAGVLGGCGTPGPRVNADDPSLASVAERSNYTQTARHAEVVALLDRLAAASPLARRVDMGHTTEGRAIPMIVMADPPVATPEEARQAASPGKVVVLAIGNIHAGEVDGKEALPMLAREILLGDQRGLLKDLVVVFAPIYNADGNERVGNNRPTQNGPALTGIRENANGRDLNRDFIKLEEAETTALVGFMNAWDPQVFIDCHITNGSLHRYLISYAGPKGPATDAELVRFCREEMFPAIARDFEASTPWKTFWYGSFGGVFSEDPRDRSTWGTFPAEGRFGTTYAGLRNRLSILVESYTYAPYKDRVLGTRAYVLAALRWAAGNARGVHALLRGADARAIEAGRTGAPVALRSKVGPFPEPVTILGFEEEFKDGRPVSTGRTKDYTCALWDRFEATHSINRPRAYAILPGPVGEKLAAKVRQHGLRTTVLSAASGPRGVEVHRVRAMEPASRAFQGHVLVKIDTEATKSQRALPAGTVLVATDQPLGTLAAYLLEPMCEDGLGTWNAYDPWLKLDGEIGVWRVIE
jgi:hypothetical protein